MCEFCCYQEKQLRVNMGITKLREKVKEQQEKVGKTVHIFQSNLWFSGKNVLLKGNVSLNNFIAITPAI